MAYDSIFSWFRIIKESFELMALLLLLLFYKCIAECTTFFHSTLTQGATYVSDSLLHPFLFFFFSIEVKKIDREI